MQLSGFALLLNDETTQCIKRHLTLLAEQKATKLLACKG